MSKAANSQKNAIKWTKEACAKKDWLLTVSSWWCSFTRRRHDMHGSVDYEAIAPDGQIIHLQITSIAEVTRHVRKILTDEVCRPRAERVVRGGINRIAVVGWKNKKSCWRFLVPADFDEDMTPQTF